MTQPKIPIWLPYEDWLMLMEVLLRSELMIKDKDEAKSISRILSALFNQVGHYAKMMLYTKKTQRN